MPDFRLSRDVTVRATSTPHPAANGAFIVNFTDGNDTWAVLFSSPPAAAATTTTTTTTTTVPTLQSDVINFNDPTISLFEIWATLNWYFHLEQPSRTLDPERAGSPRGVWKVFIDIASTRAAEEAEEMGLVSCIDSPVLVCEPDDDDDDNGGGIRARYYTTRQCFWQLPASVYGSENPTLRPPKPLEYVMSSNVRHPLRPATRPGRTLYTRWIPSLVSELSFRIATVADAGLVNRWMNLPRVNARWGEAGDLDSTVRFLKAGLESKHSFPVIGCWASSSSSGSSGGDYHGGGGGDGGGDGDGEGWVPEPFGYFEIYWVREDRLGRYTDAKDWDRGVHCLVGEEKFRGALRVGVWLSSLIHFMFLDDPRTQTLMLEPRVDNEKFITYLQKAGFYKEKEFAFPHKQSALMKLKREAWDGPVS